jgi:branched-chain amino acid transport system ATP-binding protein
MTEHILKAESIVAGYGNVIALHDVSVESCESSITALLGSNGAGKSTFLKAIAGLVHLRAGRILYWNEDISSYQCHVRVERGIVLVPEGRMIFPYMSVEDNLRIGAFTPRARRRTKESLETVYDHFPRLKERRMQFAGTLSGGEQKMLAIGLGLMACPRFLLLDEPTLGLAPLLARSIFKTINQLRATGLTILLAEQDVRRTLRISDRAYVLENGQTVMEGTGAALLSDPKISSAYLGI